MATTRIMPLHTGKGRTIGQAISDSIDYVENPQKTDHGKLITSYQCDSRIGDAEFLFAKKRYIQKTGRVCGGSMIRFALRMATLLWKIQSPTERAITSGWGRSVRLDTLGENYSKDVLLSVIKGEKRHTPRKKKQIDQEPKRVNLLVDIQAKLRKKEWPRSLSCGLTSSTIPKPARSMWPTVRPSIPKIFWRSMKRIFCFIRRQKKPLTSWG